MTRALLALLVLAGTAHADAVRVSGSKASYAPALVVTRDGKAVVRMTEPYEVLDVASGKVTQLPKVDDYAIDVAIAGDGTVAMITGKGVVVGKTTIALPEGERGIRVAFAPKALYVLALGDERSRLHLVAIDVAKQAILSDARVSIGDNMSNCELHISSQGDLAVFGCSGARVVRLSDGAQLGGFALFDAIRGTPARIAEPAPGVFAIGYAVDSSALDEHEHFELQMPGASRATRVADSNRCALAPSGRVFACAKGTTVELRDTTPAHAVRGTVRFPSPLDRLVFADDTHLVGLQQDGRFASVRVSTSAPAVAIPKGTPVFAANVPIASDVPETQPSLGKPIELHHGVRGFAASDAQLAVQTSDGVEVVTLATGATKALASRRAEHLAWSPDGTQLLVQDGKTPGEHDKPLHLNIYAGDAKPRELAAGDGEERVAWSAKNRIAVDDPGASSVRILDATTGAKVRTLAAHHERSYLMDLAFAPDGRLAIAGWGGPGLVFDVETGKSTELGQHTSDIERVAWSRDGKRVVTLAQDGTIIVRDAATLAPTATIHGHYERNEIAISPDGTRLAIAAAMLTPKTGGLEIWSLDGKPLARYPMPDLAGRPEWIGDAIYFVRGSSIAALPIAR